MYDKAISRRDPGLMVFLIDTSDSMKSNWAGTGMSLAQGAALAINRILLELCIKSTKEAGGAMRDYFFTGLYLYGFRPSDGGEGVESALPGGLASRGIVPLSELAAAPLGIREEPSIDSRQVTSRTPVWIEAHHGWRTPMCQAFALVGAHVYEWASAFPESAAPIIINVTDGMVTDSPYQGATLSDWAARMTSIRTADGATLLLNVFLSPTPSAIISYPASAKGLPEPGPGLFSISSPLPQPMVTNARAAGIDVPEGARGLVFNADLSTLVSFLEIGTRVNIMDA